MIIKKVPYVNPENYQFVDQKRKEAARQRIKKQMDKFAFSADDFNFANT